MTVLLKNAETYQTAKNEYILFKHYIENDFVTYNDEEQNNNSVKRYNIVYQVDIENEFKDMQERIMKEQIPNLTRLLKETSFDDGYESIAEKYFDELYEKYGTIADTVLQNIYLQNMYENKYLLKHLLFIVANLPKDRRKNLEILLLAGISNPDIEIQDLSVKCFESWEDKRHIPTLEKMYRETTITWFKEYILEVIENLKEG